MKQVLVLSDIHNDYIDNLSKIKEMIEMCDLIIFAGDGYAKLLEFMKKNEFDKNKLIAVGGNCDSSINSLSDEKIFMIEDVSVLLTHGHKYAVRHGTAFLEEIAKLNQCNLIIYGHTHIYNYFRKNDLTILNSGALEGCRDKMECTYSLMTVNGKKITAVKMTCPF